MIRSIWKPALALGAVLAATGPARADDRDTHLLAGGASVGTTMTLGGKGTAAQAAAEDTELTHGYRYRGGYYGWGGGYGYRGYSVGYYGGYRGGYGWNGYGGYYGGYSSFNYYRPAYYAPYYAPRVYYSSYYSSFPVYPTYSTYYNCGPSVGLYLGIGGGAGTGAPTVPLGGGLARPPAATQPMAPPVAPDGGTFPYDGGPANPVPLPKADPNAAPPADPMTTATDLPISLKPKAPAPQYRYKAYGEK